MTCSKCRSRAISATESEDDGLKKRFWLRCGECGTWRTDALGMLGSFSLERRLRRDLRRMARGLSELETAGPTDTTVEWRTTRS
jgi:hypothetical protein